ncbi:glycoside hydrolase family 65 protein [Microbacterium oleivorans]|uniref:glycoside hydrolase family 65 protein n=1 Tax=Microbacterium oleivorans TaxID=273677 RepID=UPI00139001EE|nr:glycoside hydrolase family 65 protein [Microbacterium oleivorans]
MKPVPNDAWRRGECRVCRIAGSEWILDAVDLARVDVGDWEARATLANGYFATRGATSECNVDTHDYPATYVAGVYNRLTSLVDGREREDESLVNLPNWLALRLRTGSNTLLGGGKTTLLHDHRALDLKNGRLLRDVSVEEPDGNRTIIREDRLLSMRHPHLASVRTVILPVNWSGRLSVEGWIEGDVRNDNVAAFRGLSNSHLETGPARADLELGGCVLLCTTRQSRVRIAIATRTQLSGAPAARIARRAHSAGLQWSVPVSAGAEFVIDRTAAVYTSRDRAISEPESAAMRDLDLAPNHPELRRSQSADWNHIWRHMHIVVDVASPIDQTRVQRHINVHLFHVAQTLSRHTIDADVGVSARGLHGEGYRGHVFWDELFVFPFLNLRAPELTRSLLMYRYRRLTEARREAESIGESGALFPWQSGSDGREETPAALFNPRSGRWMPDNSHLQFHVGLAVAYNVWQYFRASDDLTFLSVEGAEMLIEVARFWSSRAEFDPHTGRFHLRGTMGPDEFHDGYPGRAGDGIDDNAYVAVMVSWLLRTILRLHRHLSGEDDDGTWRRLQVEPGELRRWERVSRLLHVPFLRNGILAQFEGYDALAEFDFPAYRSRYGDIGRLDLILEAEGETTNRYQVSKQADVVMLFYLFSAEEITDLLSHLGYHFDAASIPRTIDYYLARTTHGSTLSKAVHAWVLARGDRAGAWRLLQEALDTDIDDTREGSTREGIHLAAMAATADMLHRCFTGLTLGSDSIGFHPRLPAALTQIRFDLRFRGHLLSIVLSHETLGLTSRNGPPVPITVVVNDRVQTISRGECATWDLR